jgi:multidrug resistance efflux pump
MTLCSKRCGRRRPICCARRRWRERAGVSYQQKKTVSGRRQSLAGRGAVSQEVAEDAQAAEEIAQSEFKVAESDAAVAAVL